MKNIYSITLSLLLSTFSLLANNVNPNISDLEQLPGLKVNAIKLDASY